MSASQTVAPYNPHAAIRRNLRIGLVVLAFLVLGVGGLSATVTMAGAVVASGSIVVSSNVKKIQHPTGGVVAEIRVKDGSHVKAGDVLVSLDPTVTGANVNIVSDAVDQLTAKQTRLEAERDSRDSVHFPAELLAHRNRPVAADAMRDELRLFQLHLTERTGQKSQLAQRKVQLEQQIQGFDQEAAAKKSQMQLIEQELVGVRELYKQNLVPLSRLNALERDAVQLKGDVAQLRAAAAEARGKIAEVQLQAIQVDESARSEAGNQLGQVESQLSELLQKRVTAQQEFSRVQIRAPQSGYVDRLAAHTIGGVIGPGEAIMYIVPDKDPLRVEVKIRPSDVDHVRVGEKANLRMSAFNVRTTPELNGTVSRVSAEAETDEKTGASFYIAAIEIPPAEIAKLKRLKLIPGMPVEAFIQTEQRTLLSYVTKPLTDQLRRAFRDD